MDKIIKKEHFEIIEKMIQSYSDIHEKITECESKMNNIKRKAKNLTDSLFKMREEELEFFSYLEKIYGPGKFDSQKNRWVEFNTEPIE